MTKQISYIARNFEDFQNELYELSNKYYPETFATLEDASIGNWFIDLNAAVSDDLSFHTDRMFQETMIDYAQKRSSLLSIARTNGIKIPGVKAASVSTRWSCQIGVNGDEPDWAQSPIIKKGSKAVGNGQIFEVMEDIDFSEQFSKDGVSNRLISPNVNNNGNITGYTISKDVTMLSGSSRIYTQVLNSENIEPFMKIVLPDDYVLSVESVLVKDGTNNTETPSITSDFMSNDSLFNDKSTYTRFYEVDTLLENRIFVPYINGNRYNYYTPETGKWVPLKYKFITDYTDNGKCFIQFGSSTNIDLSSMNNYSSFELNNLMNNPNLGELPKANTTIYILYRSGGGMSANISKGVLNTVSNIEIDYKNPSLDNSIKNNVRQTIKVTNTSPAVSGKDAPSNDEIRMMIKYNTLSQNRCVTEMDYYDRIYKMPSNFGCPFRVGIQKENNKIVINTIDINSDGTLSNYGNEVILNNLSSYLSEYRMINDYVVIKTGKVINIGILVNVIGDSSFTNSEIATQVINTIKEFMDVNKHYMGEDIYISQIEKEILSLNCVLNISDIILYNLNGSYEGRSYSSHQINQPISDTDIYSGRLIIDLNKSDYILYGESNSMFEIKYPNADIMVGVKKI